ncbi:stage II sporulation protein M [soil metagenome]
MDLDAFSAAHGQEWDRLAELAKRRRFSGADADELIDRYQAGASDLSLIRSTAGESVQGDRLSLALSRARLRFTGTSANVLSRVPAFFVWQLPAALYRIRWLCAAIAAATILIALVAAYWVSSDPRVFSAVTQGTDIKTYATKEFVEYYSKYSGGSFAAQVWTNNAFLAAQAIAFGIVGVYTPYLLIQNALNVGLAGAVMAHEGVLGNFFLYIAPHGQLELYSIFVAGAAGIRIFWAWIAPGARTRAAALAEDGRALFAIVIGLILSLLCSGLIEGLVTRQSWPWPIKIGIGTLALAAFLCYQWGVGRRASRAGATGDLDEFEAGAKQLVGG